VDLRVRHVCSSSGFDAYMDCNGSYMYDSARNGSGADGCYGTQCCRYIYHVEVW
jgi:hypothetical protein